MDKIEAMEQASEERFGSRLEDLPEQRTDEGDHPYSPDDGEWWEMIDPIDTMDADHLYEVVEIAKEQMEKAIDLIRQVVAHPLLSDDRGYYEAYLVDQLGENVHKRNPYNTDLDDLLEAIQKIGEDEAGDPE